MTLQLHNTSYRHEQKRTLKRQCDSDNRN